MTRKCVLFGMISLVLTLAACSAAPARPTLMPASATRTPVAASPSVATSTPVISRPSEATNTAVAPAPAVSPSATPLPLAAPPADLTRADSQGAVEFAVTPLNLSQPGETLEFEVDMNTHSVNLSWNLAAQSTLVTDTGLQVKGQGWPTGGEHHVSGTLSFPAKTAEGTPLLAGAKELTLTIQNADAPERTFVWDLAQ